MARTRSSTDEGDHRMTLRFNAEGDLLCPTCGCETTHVHNVLVAARGEDRDPTWVMVDVVTGETRMLPPGAAAPMAALDVRRRHAQFLLTSCEEGGHLFLVHFQQHKGATQVSTVPLPPAVADVLHINPSRPDEPRSYSRAVRRPVCSEEGPTAPRTQLPC
jgi:hypothetical protein